MTTNSVALFDSAYPTNSWRLSGGIEFSFPTNLVLAPNGVVVLVNFDPANQADLAAFWAAFPQVTADGRLFGPFTGNLANNGERIRVTRPDVPGPNGTARVLVDDVNYRDSLPWPILADGGGASLQRIDPIAYGDDPISWRASLPSPGKVLAPAQAAPAILQQPAAVSVNALSSASLDVTASGSGPLRYQWLKNGTAIPDATQSTLRLDPAQFYDAGNYSVVVMNPSAVIVSSNALVQVRQGSYFAVTPVTRNVLPGTNVTLSVTGFGSGAKQYKWLRNGQPVAGAAGETLTLSNVQSSDTGYYSVEVRDDNGVTRSGFGELNVVVKPAITQQPQDIVALEGEDATFTATASGTTPMNFRWRRGTTALTNLFSDTGTSIFTLRNVSIAQAGIYSLTITNASISLGTAANMTATSSNAVLTVLADFDRDGMADTWEVQYGFNTNNVADATLDFDGDGLNNRAEYRAGTNPKDPSDSGPLRLNLGVTSPGLLSLSFQSSSNKSYAIQMSDSILPASWSTFRAFTAGTANRTETVPVSATNRLKFFRLITPAPQ